MLKKIQWWILTVLAALALAAVSANALLYEGNRKLQESLGARNQYLQQTAGIRELYQEMAKALAELSLKNHDEDLRSMLATEGFTISPKPVQPGEATAKKGAKP